MLNWIPVKYFPPGQDLTALTQFLGERGVQHLITEDRGQQVLAVADPNIIPALEQFLENYQQGRVELPASSSKSTSNTAAQDSQVFIRHVQATPLIFVLIALSAIGAFVTNTPSGNPWLHFFTFQDFTETGFIPWHDSIFQGEVWRLLTPIFIHFGIVHLAFNMLWLWVLGQKLELFLGKWQFLTLIIVSAVCANLAQYLWTGYSNFGGMSGVIYALVGFILVSQRLTPHPLLDIPSGILGFMLLWLVLCMTGVVDLFMAGGIANANHLGGLLTGMAFAAVRKALVH